MAVSKVNYGSTTLIDLTSDTVDASKIAEGYKAHDSKGETITGTMKWGEYDVVQTTLEDGNTCISITDASGNSDTDQIISREFSGSYVNNRVIKIGSYAFCNATNITSVSFPNANTINSYAFRDCTKLTDAYFPEVTRVEDGAFINTAIVSLKFPKVTWSGFNAYSGTPIKRLDFSSLKRIGQFAFKNMKSLETLILRVEELCVLSNTTDTFSNSKIADGSGYIYVPDSLVDSYKTATNWTVFADQIKAISELEETV